MTPLLSLSAVRSLLVEGNHLPSVVARDKRRWTLPRISSPGGERPRFPIRERALFPFRAPGAGKSVFSRAR